MGKLQAEAEGTKCTKALTEERPGKFKKRPGKFKKTRRPGGLAHSQQGAERRGRV